jgi:hypothetical protein
MTDRGGFLSYFFMVLLIVAVLYVVICHGTTTSSNKNSLGTVQYDENPLMYVAATVSPTEGSIANVDGNLSLRLKPLGTYMLYDESLLLCGMPLEKFQGITEPFVLTYERVSHKSVQGVGCHVLVRADSIITKEIVQ